MVLEGCAVLGTGVDSMTGVVWTDIVLVGMLVMGRVQRAFQGKQSGLVLFMEDKIGLMIGMCNKLREHLRNWPLDQGGPYEYDLIGHPTHKSKTRVIRY
jgi:hypothetical protein